MIQAMCYIRMTYCWAFDTFESNDGPSAKTKSMKRTNNRDREFNVMAGDDQICTQFFHISFFIVFRAWLLPAFIYNCYHLRRMHVQLIRMCEHLSTATHFTLTQHTHLSDRIFGIGHYRIRKRNPIRCCCSLRSSTLNITIMVLLPEQICYAHILPL